MTEDYAWIGVERGLKLMQYIYMLVVFKPWDENTGSPGPLLTWTAFYEYLKANDSIINRHIINRIGNLSFNLNVNRASADCQRPYRSRGVDVWSRSLPPFSFRGRRAWTVNNEGEQKEDDIEDIRREEEEALRLLVYNLRNSLTQSANLLSILNEV